MNALPQQMIFAGSSLLCAGLGSVHDVRDRRIPNFITGPACLLGLALHFISGGWPALAAAGLAGAVGGGIFLLFFLAGGMGAGDVKLMAAVGCLTGLSTLPRIILSTVIAGAVFALAVALYNGCLRRTLSNVGELLQHHGRRGLVPHADLNLRNEGTLRLPFALPIAAGCLFTLFSLGLEARP